MYVCFDLVQFLQLEVRKLRYARREMINVFLVLVLLLKSLLRYTRVDLDTQENTVLSVEPEYSP